MNNEKYNSGLIKPKRSSILIKKIQHVPERLLFYEAFD